LELRFQVLPFFVSYQVEKSKYGKSEIRIWQTAIGMRSDNISNEEEETKL